MKDVTEKNFGVILTFPRSGSLTLFESRFTCLTQHPHPIVSSHSRPAVDGSGDIADSAGAFKTCVNPEGGDRLAGLQRAAETHNGFYPLSVRWMTAALFGVYLTDSPTRLSTAVSLLVARASVLFGGMRNAPGKFGDRACAILG